MLGTAVLIALASPLSFTASWDASPVQYKTAYALITVTGPAGYYKQIKTPDATTVQVAVPRGGNYKVSIVFKNCWSSSPAVSKQVKI